MTNLRKSIFVAIGLPCLSAFTTINKNNLSFRASIHGIMHHHHRQSSTSLHAAKVSDVLKNPQFPPEWPYSAEDFQRDDESSDTYFYNQPRLVFHIDEAAIDSLTKYYRSKFFAGASVLDVCSSWVGINSIFLIKFKL
jgi:hypothetical protein